MKANFLIVSLLAFSLPFDTECQITCQVPNVQNATFSDLKNPDSPILPGVVITVNTTIALNCSDGFEAHGSLEATCNFRGTLEPPPGKCIENGTNPGTFKAGDLPKNWRAFLPKTANGSGARVAGGKDAEEGQFPFAVYLMLFPPGGSAPTTCGGTLIAPDWVLTAAHCIESQLLSGVALLGVTNLESMTVSDIGIESFHVHPLYNYSAKVHDIALIKLRERADMSTSRIATLDLPDYSWCSANYSETMVAFDSCVDSLTTVVGWGFMVRNKTVEKATILQQAELRLRSFRICNLNLKTKPNFTDGVLCAGGDSEADTCKGDSGSPILCRISLREWQFLGLTSYGAEGCGVLNTALPGVYTRVCRYVTWIDRTMRGLEFVANEIGLPKYTRPLTTTTMTTTTATSSQMQYVYRMNPGKCVNSTEVGQSSKSNTECVAACDANPNCAGFNKALPMGDCQAVEIGCEHSTGIPKFSFFKREIRRVSVG